MNQTRDPQLYEQPSSSAQAPASYTSKLRIITLNSLELRTIVLQTTGLSFLFSTARPGQDVWPWLGSPEPKVSAVWIRHMAATQAEVVQHTTEYSTLLENCAMLVTGVLQELKANRKSRNFLLLEKKRQFQLASAIPNYQILKLHHCDLPVPA